MYQDLRDHSLEEEERVDEQDEEEYENLLHTIKLNLIIDNIINTIDCK